MMAETIARTLGGALVQTSEGRPCFPCARSKRPTSPRGFLDASADPIALRELWSKFPGQLVGVRTGDASGIDLLDLDRKHRDKALVTGGAGFLGSHVVDHLLKMGMRVVVLDDLSGGFERNIPADAEFYRGSIMDESTVTELFTRHRFRYVYHLAAYPAEGLSHFVRRFNYSVNLLGSVNLINAAVNHETECCVFISSIAVYGSAQCPFCEDTAPIPEDPYGIDKLAVEHDLRAAHKLFGLPYIIFRPHNVYGERQNLSDPYRNVIGIFMSQILRGRPCTIFGDGHQTRAFSHVSDVARLIAQSVRVPAARDEIFNVGAEESYTIGELAAAVRRAMARQVGVEYLPAREEVLHAFSNHSKARRVFGHMTYVDLEEGLRRMARWAVTVEPAPPMRANNRIEIAKKLPASWAGSRPQDP
jgi:UDP-glucose 4-epimerase